jgi:hypothetical protein
LFQWYQSFPFDLWDLFDQLDQFGQLDRLFLFCQ